MEDLYAVAYASTPGAVVRVDQAVGIVTALTAMQKFDVTTSRTGDASHAERPTDPAGAVEKTHLRHRLVRRTDEFGQVRTEVRGDRQRGADVGRERLAGIT